MAHAEFEEVKSEVERITSLDGMLDFLKDTFPNTMVLNDMPEFDRIKLAGATDLALELIDMIEGK